MPEGVGLGCVAPPPPCELRILDWTGAVDGAGFGLRRAMARGSLSGTISPLLRNGERMGADCGAQVWIQFGLNSIVRVPYMITTIRSRTGAREHLVRLREEKSRFTAPRASARRRMARVEHFLP